MSDGWADHTRNGFPLCCLRRSSESSLMNNCTNLQETAALGAALCGDDRRSAYFLFSIFSYSLLVFLVESVPIIISIQACSPSRRLLNRAEESVRVVALTSETDCPCVASRWHGPSVQSPKQSNKTIRITCQLQFPGPADKSPIPYHIGESATRKRINEIHRK